MNTAQRIMAVLLVLGAVLIQVSIGWRIEIVGATPNLMILVVASLALLMGSMYGAALGFTAGISIALFSLLPLGPHALIATLIGYSIGRVGEVLTTDDHPVPPLVAGILATLAYSIGRPLVEFLINPSAHDIAGVWQLAFVSALLAAILAIPVYLGVRRALVFVGSPNQVAQVRR